MSYQIISAIAWIFLLAMTGIKLVRLGHASKKYSLSPTSQNKIALSHARTTCAIWAAATVVAGLIGIFAIPYLANT